MKIASITLVVMSLPAICLGYLRADFDYNGTVDFNDFATFSSQWLEENSEMNYGSGGSAAYYVASYEASAQVKDRADYVCDGVDDQVEIQAAIDKVGQESPRWGGVVVLSGGQFNPTASINLGCSDGTGQYISLWGMNNGIIGTTLDWAAGTNCDGIIYHATAGGLLGDFSLRRLRIINRNDGDYWGVKITADPDKKTYDCVYEDVFVQGGGDSNDYSHGGMYIERDWATHFSRCSFEASRGSGLVLEHPYGVMLTDCFFAGNCGDGLKINSGSEVSMVNCSAHSNGKNTDSFFACGMNIRADYSSLTNIHLFSNYGWGIYLAGQWSRLTNCMAYGNGKGLSGGAWKSGGICISSEHITVVNCQAWRNWADVNCFGYFIEDGGVNLIGCRSVENSKGLYVAAGCEEVCLDVQFEDNLIDDYIQGSGAHPIFARRNYKTTVSDVSYEVEKVDNGTIYISNTTSNNVTFALPGAVVGLEFEFFFSDGANQLQIDPYGSEEIYENNSSQGVGKYIYADEVGESIKLKCIYPGRWEMVDKIGTWAAEP